MARVSFADRKQLAGAIVSLLLFAAIGYGVFVVVLKVIGLSLSFLYLRLGVALAIGFGLATWVVGLRLNDYTPSELGWRRPALRPWLQGVGIGVATAAIALVLALVTGTRFIFSPQAGSWLRAFVPLALGLALASLGAELAYRAFPLRRLTDAIGMVPATLTIAVIAAVVQSRGSFTTFFGVVNVVLATIWLSVAFFSAGGFPLAWGAHFGWMATLTLLNASAGAFVFETPGVIHLAGPHSWIDGGLAGIEGGIVASLALFAGILYVRGRKGAFPASHDAPLPLAGTGQRR
jgi:hypothetical protein